jgi:hypothetical protein
MAIWNLGAYLVLSFNQKPRRDPILHTTSVDIDPGCLGAFGYLDRLGAL